MAEVLWLLSVIRRYFEYKVNEVNIVKDFTDVDDKIIDKKRK